MLVRNLEAKKNLKRTLQFIAMYYLKFMYSVNDWKQLKLDKLSKNHVEMYFEWTW